MDYGDLQYDLQRCRDLLDEEHYGEAWEIAQELLSRAPLDPEVVCLAADAALPAGAAGAAIRAIHRLLRAGTRDTEVLEWLARAQWDLGLVEQCRATCRQLLESEPDNQTALALGLDTLLVLGDFDRGDDLVEKAIAGQGDDPDLGFQVAQVRMMRGETEWAMQAFQAFLDREPYRVDAYISLMRIHQVAGRYGEVRAIYERATEKGLDHEDLHYHMGLALKSEEQEREAAPYFIAAIRAAAEKQLDVPDAHFQLAQILRGEGHPRFGLWMLERELAVDDTHPAVHAEMAWCAEDLGNYADAVRMIRAAVERDPGAAFYLHSLAELLLKSGAPLEEAEEAARTAVSLDAEHAAGWQVLGRGAAERGEIGKAEDCLRRAIRCADATAEDQGWLGLVLFRDGRSDAAVKYLEFAARVHPLWPPVGEALGKIRGSPLSRRYEVRLTGAGRNGRPWYRVLHVVAGTEMRARGAAIMAADDQDGDRGVVEDVTLLGFEVDHADGVLWDSGRTGRRYPEPPAPEASD